MMRSSIFGCLLLAVFGCDSRRSGDTPPPGMDASVGTDAMTGVDGSGVDTSSGVDAVTGVDVPVGTDVTMGMDTAVGMDMSTGGGCEAGGTYTIMPEPSMDMLCSLAATTCEASEADGIVTLVCGLGMGSCTLTPDCNRCVGIVNAFGMSANLDISLVTNSGTLSLAASMCAVTFERS